MKKSEKHMSKYAGSQWYVVWHSFKKNKLAVAGAIVIVFLYLAALFAEFVAPYTATSRNRGYLLAKPVTIHVVDEEGQWHTPFVYGYKQQVNPSTLAYEGVEDTTVRYPIRFFVKGEPYKMLGIIESDIHLFGLEPEAYEAGARIYLMGADSLGRDMFSRIVYGTRISMTLGLVGIFISMTLGIVLGMIAGYFGGIVDVIISRVIEVLSCIPSIPLWMALGAAIPVTWSTPKTFFAITTVLSFLGWTGMARMVRGKILQMKEKDFVKAAQLDNAKLPRIMMKYLLPSVQSQLIATATACIPGMILGETSMSYLGLGLQPPAISWGVMLQDAQTLGTLLMNPHLLLTVIPVIVVCLAFNFMGDGLRNAADPFKN